MQKGGLFTGGALEDFGKDLLNYLKEYRARMELIGPPAPPAAEPRRVRITGGTVVPPRGGGGGGGDRSSYEREYAQIEKQIALMDARQEGIGETVETQKALEIQTRLLESAERDGITVTQAYMDEIDALAGRYGKAVAEAAALKEQVAKINSASQQFGQALSTGLADAIIEGKKLNEVFKSLSRRWKKLRSIRW